MSKSAEFWNCLYYTELLLQPIFNELSALAVEVSCFLKLTSTDFSPREKKLRSEKKLRQKIRSLLLVVLLLKKPKHFARKKNNIKEPRDTAWLNIMTWSWELLSEIKLDSLQKIFLEWAGIDLGFPRMLARRSTTELLKLDTQKRIFSTNKLLS